MDVNGVVTHGAQVAEADAHELVALHHERRRAWIGLAVEGEHVELEHLVGVGTSRPRQHLPFARQQREVAIGAAFGGHARMNHEHPHHAERLLRHFVAMRVVHVRAMLPQRELVAERLAGGDGRLTEPRNAIHPRGEQNAVPVHTRGRGERVGHVDAHAIALHRFDGGSRRAAVESPALRSQTGGKLVLDRFGNEVKHLHAVHDGERQRGAVGGDDRGIVAPRATWRVHGAPVVRHRGARQRGGGGGQPQQGAAGHGAHARGQQGASVHRRDIVQVIGHGSEVPTARSS